MKTGRSERVYIELSRSDVAWARFLLEAHDNLAYLSVVDKYRAVARMAFSADQKEEVTGLLRSWEQSGLCRLLPDITRTRE